MIFVPCQFFNREACRRDPPCAPEAPCWIAQRAAKLLSQLSSEHENVVLKTVTALNQFLANEKLNFSDIANLIEQRRYDQKDMTEAFELGKGKGQQTGTQRQSTALEFFDIDGEPCWYQIAVFLQQNAERLRPGFETEFATDIASKVLSYGPSQKQARIILKLFVKLGGYCDPSIQARYFPR